MSMNDKERGESWKDEPMDFFIRRIKDELKEVEKAVRERQPYHEVAKEFADIANFCMMGSDRAYRDAMQRTLDNMTPEFKKQLGWD